MAIILNDSNDEPVSIDQGESANIVVQFTFAGVAISKGNLVSLTVTLYDQKTSTIINSRSLQNVLDANNGLVATDGTLTLRLGPADNIIVSTTTISIGMKESHLARFNWTWTDGVSTRTGTEEVLIRVLKLATPVLPA